MSIDKIQMHDNLDETAMRLPCCSVTNSWSFSTIFKTNFRREGVKLRGKLEIKRLLTAGRPKCFLRDTLSIALTQNASIEFYTHSDVSIPCPNIHTHVTSCKRLEQTMGDNEVSFLIGWEDLLRFINGSEMILTLF